MLAFDQLSFDQPKSSVAILDYSIDWTPWLAADNADELLGATFTIAPVLTVAPYGIADPADMTVAPAVPPITGGIATCWLSAGLPGRVYRLTCTVVTTGARTDSRGILLQCVP